MIDLYPHQIQGADFLSSRKFAGLFAGMGTGKTLTALEAVYRSNARRVVVIAPPIALPMWAKEADKWLNNSKHDGWGIDILKTGKSPLAELSDCTLIVVSYAIAAKRAEELRDWLRYGDGGETATSVLICDESHALKSATAKRTKAILGRGGIANGASHSWMLTGTPITRWNDDMFPFLCRSDREGMVSRKLNNLERFQLRYTVRQSRKFSGARFPKQMVVGNRNTRELADWIYGEGHALRFDLDEVFKDMPPLTTNRYAIPLDADAELKAELKQLSKMSTAKIKALAQQQAGGRTGWVEGGNEPHIATIRRRLGLAKVKAAAQEIKDRVESGQKVLVGAWHTAVIDELYAALKGCTRAVIDGRTSAASRETSVSEWNLGHVDVLIGQIAAMGVSLNLQQGGNQIIVVEEDWSPSVMDQFYARLWRFGQEKHVHVDVLQSESKLDAALSNISSTKRRQHQIFNTIGKAYTDAQ